MAAHADEQRLLGPGDRGRALLWASGPESGPGGRAAFGPQSHDHPHLAFLLDPGPQR